MPEWQGAAHDAEHDRIVRELALHGRNLERLKLSPEERRAVQSAASKLVAEEAIAANRSRQAPIWRDRRAMGQLGVQAVVAVVAVLALLHSINPGLP